MIPKQVIQLAKGKQTRKVARFEGYFVTEDGDVITIRNGRWGINADRARFLREQTIAYNYRAVYLSDGKSCKLHYVHRIVLEAFVGIAPKDKPFGCHNDGNPLNNHISNLRWDDRAGNTGDSKTHGTFAPPPKQIFLGSQNGFSKLTESDVKIIRELLGSGLTQKQIANMFNISDRTVGDIKRGKSWAWLK